MPQADINYEWEGPASEEAVMIRVTADVSEYSASTGPSLDRPGDPPEWPEVGDIDVEGPEGIEWNAETPTYVYNTETKSHDIKPLFEAVEDALVEDAAQDM